MRGHLPALDHGRMDLAPAPYMIRINGHLGVTSPEAHRAGLDRVMHAGGRPISWVSLAVELQRGWARQDTVAAIIEIVLADRLLKEQ